MAPIVLSAPGVVAVPALHSTRMVPGVSDSERTKIWLVNKETVTVEGAVDAIVGLLAGSGGNLTALTDYTGGRVYVNPVHVTHVEPGPSGTKRRP